MVGGEVRTKYVLKDGLGRMALLLVVRKGDELVYAFGKKVSELIHDFCARATTLPPSGPRRGRP